MSKPGRRIITAAALLAAYFIAGKLALLLAFLHPSATPIWPNSGIALAALLILGIGYWPVIFLGAFLVNLTTAGSIGTSMGIAIGNTLEAVVGAWLVLRFAGGENAVFRTVNILKFSLLAGILSTAIAATIGVTSLALGGYARWDNFWPVWVTWWLGDAVGDVMVAPVILLWVSNRLQRWKWDQIRPEAIALLVLVIVSGQIVFNGYLPGFGDYGLEYLCMPFLAWAAMRFGQREAAVTMLAFAASAIWGTLDGYGPFQGDSLNESLVLLQAFLGVGTIMSLVLSAEICERRRAELEALSLATVDPLTGLGNQRKLIESLEAEIRRSERSGRSLAFVLLDLDGLKRINDRNGHLVGNRAICRLADTLRLQCRGSDTTARYGGDEFAIILPDSNRQVAEFVTRRIQAALLAEAEQPMLSVSAGIAVWPENGTTIEELLRTADGALYEMKRRGGGRFIRPAQQCS